MELAPKETAILVASEETLWWAETRYDFIFMEDIFASDFTEIGRSGRCYDRQEMFSEPDPEALLQAQFPLPDYFVRLIAPDVALATYTSEVRYGDEIVRGRRSSL